MKSRKYSKYKKSSRQKSNAEIWARVVFAALLISLLALLGYGVHRLFAHESHTEPEPQAQMRSREFPTGEVVFNGSFQGTFDDLQDVQILAAMEMGISPMSNADSVPYLVQEGALVPVYECPLYETEQVSLPYLVPDAKALLDEIANRYQRRAQDGRQLRLSSCLRTDETIARLRRNVNSVKNSCHLYGTTFDISYRNMEYKEKCILAQVLLELRDAGHCYVKYERKQPCFHITVRPEP